MADGDVTLQSTVSFHVVSFLWRARWCNGRPMKQNKRPPRWGAAYGLSSTKAILSLSTCSESPEAPAGSSRVPFHLLVCFSHSCYSCSPLARPTPQNSNTQHPTTLQRTPPHPGYQGTRRRGSRQEGRLPTSTNRARGSREPRQPHNLISQNPQAPAARGGAPSETSTP